MRKLNITTCPPNNLICDLSFLFSFLNSSISFIGLDTSTGLTAFLIKAILSENLHVCKDSYKEKIIILEIFF